MPVVAKCKGCEYELYDGEFKGGSGPSVPQKIIDSHHRRCPNCGRKLELPTSKDIRISPAPGVEYMGRKERESRRKYSRTT